MCDILKLMTNVCEWTFHNALNWKIEHLLDRLHTWDSSSSICRHQHTSLLHLVHMVCCKWILGALSYHQQTGHLQWINSVMYKRLLYCLCFLSLEVNMHMKLVLWLTRKMRTIHSFHSTLEKNLEHVRGIKQVYKEGGSHFLPLCLWQTAIEFLPLPKFNRLVQIYVNSNNFSAVFQLTYIL